VAEVRRYRLDDLRRFATALLSGLGVPAARSSALASLLLWFDAAGAAPFGIASLSTLLEQLESGEIAREFEGKVVSERTGTAVFDGGNGVPLLLLERAGALATEKARDAGVGLVRVSNVGLVASAAAVAAEMAVGPTAAVLVGPGHSWAAALPGAGALPTVFDPSLPVREGAAPSTSKAGESAGPSTAVGEPLAGLWARLLAGERGWIVAAYTVTAQEPLVAFQQRVAGAVGGLEGRDGLLLPASWEARRVEARERGVAIAATAWKALGKWAGRLGVTPPEHHALAHEGPR
jgi:LDH2 family malate/lactate/ureidoglycolate dehydrogenase